MSNLKRLGLLNRAGMQACGEKRLDDALFQLNQAAKVAAQMQSPLHEAKVRNNMGIVHTLAGNVDQARECYDVAARITREQAGTDNGLYRSIMRNLQSAKAA